MPTPSIRRSLYAAALSLLMTLPVAAQPTSDEAMIERIRTNDLNVFAGLSFLVMNPQGALRDSLRSLGAPSTGYGFTLHAGYHLAPVPVAFALEGGVAFMGGSSRREYLQSGFFRDTLSYETQTSIVPVNASVRVQPNLATWVFPYVEAVGGFNLYLSNFSLSQTRFDVVRSQSDSRSDLVWTYGVGAGLAIKVADLISLPNSLQRVTVDARMRYMFGGDAEVSTVKLEDTTYSFRTATVGTSDMVTFAVGITMQF